MFRIFFIFFLFFMFFIGNYTFDNNHIYTSRYPDIFNFNDITYIHSIKNKSASILIENIFPINIYKKIVNEYHYLDRFRQNRLLLNNDIIHSDKLINNNALITKITQSQNFTNFISKIIKNNINTTNFRFPYSNFIQISDKINHKLDWHYDLNFYQGSIYVGVYTLINRDKYEDKHSSQQHCQKIDKKIKCFDTPENSLLIFRADKILHKVLPIKLNETRVVFQTLFTTDLRQSFYDKLKMYTLTTEGMHLLIYSNFKDNL